MKYEIVNLEEKIIAGLKITTSNDDPFIVRNMGNLWEKFIQEEVYKEINNPINHKAIGVYGNYESDVNGKYDAMVGLEVKSFEKKDNEIQSMIIPKGKFAKFIIKGNVQTVVVEFWQKLWKMKIERIYTCDFEEYQNQDMENAEIHIYISIKQS